MKSNSRRKRWAPKSKVHKKQRTYAQDPFEITLQHCTNHSTLSRKALIPIDLKHPKPQSPDTPQPQLMGLELGRNFKGSMLRGFCQEGFYRVLKGESLGVKGSGMGWQFGSGV